MYAVNRDRVPTMADRYACLDSYRVALALTRTQNVTNASQNVVRGRSRNRLLPGGVTAGYGHHWQSGGVVEGARADTLRTGVAIQLVPIDGAYECTSVFIRDLLRLCKFRLHPHGSYRRFLSQRGAGICRNIEFRTLRYRHPVAGLRVHD
jgi:hypothetical protein